MGIYSKEVFGGDAPSVVADQGASTAFSNYDASHCLGPAVIKTVLEGYVAFSAGNGSMKSVQEAQQFISEFTKELVDNGEITAADLQDIQEWINHHSGIFSGNRGGCEHKLFGKILCNCTNVSGCPELEEVQKLHSQLQQAKARALAKLEPAICKEVAMFFQRYGRKLDQTYASTWTNFCSPTA